MAPITSTREAAQPTMTSRKLEGQMPKVEYRIEPLDPARHRRAELECESAELAGLI